MMPSMSVTFEAGVDDGVAHRLDQKIEARHARHLAEPAVPGADDGADVAQFTGWFDHGSVSCASWLGNGWHHLIKFANARHHVRRRGIDTVEQRVDLLAADRVDFGLLQLGVVEEGRILHGGVEGRAQRVDAVARHARRQHERSAHHLLGEGDLEHLLVGGRGHDLDRGRHVGKCRRRASCPSA